MHKGYDKRSIIQISVAQSATQCIAHVDPGGCISARRAFKQSGVTMRFLLTIEQQWEAIDVMKIFDSLSYVSFVKHGCFEFA